MKRMELYRSTICIVEFESSIVLVYGHVFIHVFFILMQHIFKQNGRVFIFDNVFVYIEQWQGVEKFVDGKPICYTW